MRSQRHLDITAMVAALALAAAAGITVSYGQFVGVALTFGGCAAIAIALAAASRAAPQQMVYLACGAGVALIAENGLRLNGSTTYSDAVLVVVAVAVGIGWATGNLSPQIPSWLSLGGALILLSALLVALFPPVRFDNQLLDLIQSQNHIPGESEAAGNLTTAVRLLFALIAVPLTIGLVPATWRQGRRLVDLWLIGVGVSSFVAVLAALTSLDLQHTLTGVAYDQASTASFVGRESGLTVQPSAFGLTAAMALPVVFSRMVNTTGGVRYLPLAVLYVLGAFVSGSRTAAVLCGVGFILVFAWQYRARRQLVVIAVTTTAAIVALEPYFTSFATVQRLTGAPGAGGASGAVSSAKHASRVAEGLHVFLARPIGYGFEAVRGAHNVALQMLDSGGVLALTGYAVVLYGAIKLGWSLKADVPVQLQPDVLGLVGSLAVWTVATVVESASFDRYLYVPIGLLLGMYFIRQRTSRLSTETRPRVA